MEAGQRIIRGIDRLINIALGVALVAVFLYGGYALYDTWTVYNKAALPGEIIHYKPTKDEPSLLELQAINGDVCAWITIDGTNIDYPVVQGKDNMEYLNRDIYGEYSLGGSIFLDHGNSPDFSDFYSLLYGHHMDGGAMFGDVKKYDDEAYFESHPGGWLMTAQGTYRLEIFACVNADAYDAFMFTPGVSGEENKAALLNYIKEKACNFRETDVDTSDRLIALSTCSSATTNGRTIVVARLVECTETGGE